MLLPSGIFSSATKVELCYAGGQLEEDRILREPAAHLREMLKLKNAFGGS
jgi:hypothetical protein